MGTSEGPEIRHRIWRITSVSARRRSEARKPHQGTRLMPTCPSLFMLASLLDPHREGHSLSLCRTLHRPVGFPQKGHSRCLAFPGTHQKSCLCPFLNSSECLSAPKQKVKCLLPRVRRCAQVVSDTIPLIREEVIKKERGKVRKKEERKRDEERTPGRKEGEEGGRERYLPALFPPFSPLFPFSLAESDQHLPASSLELGLPRKDTHCGSFGA